MPTLALFCALSLVGQAPAAVPYQPQHPDPVLEPWRWRVFTELKGAGLRALAEDGTGALWFGVTEGVLHYDGLIWSNYTPADGLVGAPVNALGVGRDGTVYAGSDMGISQYRDGGWSRLFPPEGDLPWPVDRIVEDGAGRLWAATAWGALRLDGGRAVLYTTADMSRTLRDQAPYVDLVLVPDAAAPAHAWGGAAGTGIKLLKGGYLGLSRGGVPMVVWAQAPGGPGPASGLEVGDRVLTIEGLKPVLPHLALGGAVGSVVKMEVVRPGVAEPFTVEVRRDSVAGAVRGFSLSDLMIDRQGRLWCALSWGGELVRHDPADGSWRLYDGRDGLMLGDRPRLEQTRDGAVWSISNHGVAGVNRFDGQTWTHMRLKELGGNDINTSILETSDGTLWIGGHSGRLHVLRDGVWEVHPAYDMPVSEARLIGLLETADRALWIAGLGQEAARLDYGPARWTSYTNLDFRCEDADGALWFTVPTGGVVRLGVDGAWTQYGVADGLMASPRGVMPTRDGVLWAVGQHDDVAATAIFAAGRWELKKHPRLAATIDERGMFEAADGALWFASGVHRVLEKGHLGGVLRYRPDRDEWTHFLAPEAPAYAGAITQTADGLLWFGGSGLNRFDGEGWSYLEEPKELRSWIHGLLGPRSGGLWAGTRTYGMYHFDGREWRQYGVRDGVANNRIKAVHQTADGSVWAVSDKGISRFDGDAWIAHALPLPLAVQPRFLDQTRDGALWVSDFSMQRDDLEKMTLRYAPERDPPETEIDARIVRSLKRVSQPGNATITWSGTDRWQMSAEDELQYAWRLNGGDWTPFTQERIHTFFALDSGDYRFEVKARDRDFNEDPTPAALVFAVEPPIWKQPWFAGLMAIMLVGIAVQTGRVVASKQKLEENNERLAEANIQIQEANRAKSAFLANMSHELRTPLNAILGFAQLLGRDRSLSGNQRDKLEVINRSGGHLLALINDVLDISKIEAGRVPLEVGAFDLHNLIADLENMFRLRAEDKGVRFRCERGDLPRYLHGDEHRLRQVLINLLGNAAKFTAEGEMALRVGYDGRRLEVAVEDSGPGIAAEEMATLFEAFVQTDSGRRTREGSGLGLPISRQLVRLMGGEIEVDSQVGRGSVFRFAVELPPAREEEVAAADPLRQVVGLEPGQPDYRILVVEDQPDNRALLVDLLTAAGFAVREAVNGEEGVAAWRDWAPHFIWMDMGMPVMDGYEATRRIKADDGEVPIVAITASAFEEDRTAVMAAGCDGFVRKPYRAEEVFAAMVQHLGVRFTYEKEAAATTRAALRREDFTGLGAELRADLHRAAVQADDEAISTLVRTLVASDPDLAAALAELVAEYRFDQIVELTAE